MSDPGWQVPPLAAGPYSYSRGSALPALMFRRGPRGLEGVREVHLPRPATAMYALPSVSVTERKQLDLSAQKRSGLPA